MKIAPQLVRHSLPWFMPASVHRGSGRPTAMTRLNLHLVSDSTGETLEMIAKAALAQFDNPSVNRHFWPMVRSLQHLDRIVPDLAAHPGLVLYTLVNPDTRKRLEEHCVHLGLPPPTYANKDVERDSYSAIGESDRMTLKFVKP